MPVNILMIDDHPSQIEGYKTILQYNSLNIEILTDSCYSCETAYKKITDPFNKIKYDMVFLDRSMPPYIEKKIKNGEDLALLVRQHLPKSKIVMLTSHSEAFILYNMLNKIKPEGLLVKSDFSADDLLVAFEALMKNETYYSETVLKGKKNLLAKEEFLDSFNRQIISLLSEGVKTKSLPDHINLSKSAIEKRKAQIKDYLNIEDGGDEAIVGEARKLGFI
ncbi:MAG TPA: response regulator [Salinimicrobium sp.]|nr:response regulator [Salinimicrobium sp.]